jgi:hypothetical protein
MRVVAVLTTWNESFLVIISYGSFFYRAGAAPTVQPGPGNLLIALLFCCACTQEQTAHSRAGESRRGSIQ